MESVRLDTTNFRLHRGEEQLLREAWSRIATLSSRPSSRQKPNEEEVPREIAVVVGPEGTGKATLISSIRERVERDGGIFVTGKFQSGATRPFSGIADAFGRLLDAALETTPSSSTNSSIIMARHIVSVLGDELVNMKNYIPRLGELNEEFGPLSPGGNGNIQKSNSNASSNGDANSCDEHSSLGNAMSTLSLERDSSAMFGVDGTNIGNSSSLHPTSRFYRRAQGQFRKLLRVLTQSKPVLLELQNLQLADAQSLELLEALLIDKQSRNVLFVTTSRDDEPKTWQLLRRLSGVMRRQPNELRLTKIALRHLDVYALNELLADITAMTKPQTEPLAHAVFRKTQGRMFFVRQFLELIQDQHLLLFSLRTNAWEWDLERIEAETDISENVVDTVVERMHLLPPVAQETLKIAACLGMRFDAEMVNLLRANEEAINKRDPTAVRPIMSPIAAPLQSIGSSSTSLAMNPNDRILAKPEGREPTFATMTLNDSIQGDETDKRKTKKNADNSNNISGKASDSFEFSALFQTRLVEMGTEGYVKFTHERVKQAAYSLITEKGRSRDQLHLRIGKFMFDLYSQDKYHEDWVFFSAIDQLNEGSSCITHPDDKFELASMNMTAGEIARSQSAFILAASYLSAGVQILQGTDNWIREYAFSVDLWSSAAEMEHCAGNIENCKQMVDAVLANARCLDDKLRAYFALVNLLGTQGQLDAAITLGLNVVRDLGEPFPERPRKIHISTAMNRTKRLVRGKTFEELCHMPRIKDPAKLVTLRMLTLVTTDLFICQKHEILTIVLLRFMQISLKYGMSEYTPFAYATYALVLVSDGSIDEGIRFAECAMNIIDNATPDVKTNVIFLVHMYLSHWKNPIRESLEPLMENYNLGMDCGNIEMGMLCAGVYCLMYTFSGLPLNHVAADMKKFAQQMLEYRQETVYTTISPIWQYIMNLTSDPEDPLQLTGEAMEQEELYLRAIQTENTATVRNILRYRLMLALLFGDLQLAETMYQEIEKHTDEIQAHFAIAREVFAAGITYAGLGRSLSMAIYKRKARKLLKTMEKWIKHGNVNCHDMLLLMRAECESMSRSADLNEVKKLYDAAISSSSRSGYIHNAALACEKVADFFRTRNDYAWAEDYLKKSLDYYGRWNAWSKVEDMRRSHPSLRNGDKSGDPGSIRSGSLQGRTRFKRNASLQHANIRFRRRMSDPGTTQKIIPGSAASMGSFH